MAARQDQTLQIFLIVFIFLFLVTAVVAYLGWRGYSDSDQKATALQSQLNDKNTQFQNKESELEDLKEKVGFGRNDNAPDVKKATEDDMKTYGAGVADEASRTYRKVLESVFTELQQTAAREAKLTADIKARDAHLLAVETETKKMIDEHDAARKKAEEDLADQKNKFADDRKTLETTKADLQKSLDDQRKAYTSQIEDRDSNLKKVNDQNTKLVHAVDDLKEQRKDEPESFEVADGRVSWVNQNGTVWINLGTSDSLRRQVTFSVFDADLHDAAKSKKKGSIEVTRLLSDHMAEARITKDDPKNPILTGDNIYSQIWHRGKKLHFALTGFIDIDGDGQSDLQLARDLIELNGGIVDAYLDESGKPQGEITANTRYLVYGEKSESASKTNLQQGTNDMFKEASSLGVQTITLPEFLTQMGYKPQDRTVHLGAAAKGSDFPVKPVNETTGPTTQFRSRAASATGATQ
jgi:ParB-like chromosome segregation protein Spo0J